MRDSFYIHNHNHKDVIEFFKKIKINSIFFSLKFIIFISKVLKLSPYFFCYSRSNKIVALIPFFEKKNYKYGKVINSLPFFGSMGGVYSENNNFKKICLKLFNNHFNDEEILSSVIIQNPFDDFDSKLNKVFKSNFTDDRILQYIKLNQKLNISDTRIRNVNKAKKLGFKVYKTNSPKIVDKLEKLHFSHMKKINGKPKPKIFFSELKKLDKNIWKIYYSKNKNNDVIATLLVFFENQSMEYYIPACDENYKDSQVLSLLTYNSIMDSVRKNYKFYSFGFTWINQKGVYNYKKKWGCEDKEIRYLIKFDSNKLSNINEMINLYKYFYIAPFKKKE